MADAPSRFCVGNKPANEFTRVGTFARTPMIFLNGVGSEENLFNLGMNHKPVNLADWDCPVHPKGKPACDRAVSGLWPVQRNVKFAPIFLLINHWIPNLSIVWIN